MGILAPPASVIPGARVIAPRVTCRPPGRVDSGLVSECRKVWRAAGLKLDDWQEHVVLASLRRAPDSERWAAFEVGVDVSRQNGKGGILEGRQLAGLFVLGERLAIHSTHQFDTALEAFYRLLEMIEGGRLKDRLVRVSRSHGEEGVTVLTSGRRCRLRYRTRTKGGGRGFTADTVYLDEAMVISEWMHGALLPTLSAVENPQVWYTGSAVDQLVHEHGVVFARVRERGHRGEAGLQWDEWSLDAEHPDQVSPDTAESEAAWRQANPALGIRILASHVALEQRAMDPRTFAVERLGVGDWPRTDHVAESVISIERWNELADSASKVSDPVCLAFDVSPDRQSSIAAAGRRANGDGWHVELVESRGGTGWLPRTLRGIVERNRPSVIVCDGYGPAGAVAAQVEQEGLTVVTLNGADHARACGRIADAVSEGTLTHLGDAKLAAAIQSARTRPLGDAWAWSRKSSTANISPLVSATLALSAAIEQAGASIYDRRGLVVV